MTDRISSFQSSPATTFYVEGDWISSSISGNYSVVRCYLRAVNGPGGTTGSQYNGSGSQAGTVVGVKTFATHSGNPFLPSGVQNGATRWRNGPYDVVVPHKADGTGLLQFGMVLDYGNVNVTVFSSTTSLPTIPKTPTGLTVTRVSDTQQTLAWASASPNTGAIIHRSTDDGAWQQVGAPSGNVRSFTDSTTSANHKYSYRVLSVSTAGQSGWSGTVTIYTTPAVPSVPTATRDGMDIVVSGSTVSGIATGVDVQDGSTVVASNVTLPWRHVAPNAGTPHTYTVRAVRGTLASAWSAASNTVQLIAPPNAPVGLAPNGDVAPSDADVVLSWTHNPVDSSAQSAFEVQWRPAGGAWTTISGTTVSTATVTLAAGGFEWQVRTKGTDPNWSPWSAVAAFTVIDRPGVAVIQPADTWEASTLEAEWTWFQAQSRPQSGWEARLLDGSLVVVESRNGSGAATSVTFSTRLTQGDWQVQVRAATGDVWSPWGVSLFTVTFDPPAHPIVDASWDESQGGVNLSVASGDPAGVIPPVTNLFTNPSFEDPAGIPDGGLQSSDWAASGGFSLRVTPGPLVFPSGDTYPSPTLYPEG